jgi:transmembrane sensor
MEAASAQARQVASREATEWLIALRENPADQALQRRFEAWRAASALNEAAWASTTALSDLAGDVGPMYREKWGPFVAERRRRAPEAALVGFRGTIAGVRRRWILAGVSAVSAAAIALAVVPPAIVRLYSDHATATAEVRRIDLDDGSVVILAPASAISVSLPAGGEREVRLLEGEAFFQVKPDATHPFHVVAGSVRTTVVGTSFDVRRDSKGVAVSVEEGVVQVASAISGASERLAVGDTVRMSWAGLAQRASESPQLMAGWKRGQLHAQDRSVQEAVDQLRRSYAGTIVLLDASLGERRITGVYNLADPEEALRGIARAHGAKVRRVTPWILIVSAE